MKNTDVFKPKLDISHKDYLACVKYALASNMHSNKVKASIFVRNKGAETYGVKTTQQKRRNFAARQLKIKLNPAKKRGNTRETWEEF